MRPLRSRVVREVDRVLAGGWVFLTGWEPSGCCCGGPCLPSPPALPLIRDGRWGPKPSFRTKVISVGCSAGRASGNRSIGSGLTDHVLAIADIIRACFCKCRWDTVRDVLPFLQERFNRGLLAFPLVMTPGSELLVSQREFTTHTRCQRTLRSFRSCSDLPQNQAYSTRTPARRSWRTGRDRGLGLATRKTYSSAATQNTISNKTRPVRAPSETQPRSGSEWRTDAPYVDRSTRKTRSEKMKERLVDSCILQRSCPGTLRAA